jgi:hypothetical protein
MTSHFATVDRSWGFQPPPAPYSNPAPYQLPVLPNLTPRNCHLEVIQNPLEALVTTKGKEKTRKPIDPPPIVELKVSGAHANSQQWLQSPYLFMVASLHNTGPDEPHENVDKALIGTLTSSLHRLKASDNRDGGFFIFGDMSVMIQGRFKLRFALYEMQENSGVVFLGTIDSKPFVVLPGKDFKGMAESTVLSRSFSDQGVRLRLRKEPRGLSGNKRKFASIHEESDEAAQPPNMPSESSSSLEESSSSPNKRFQREAELRKDSLPAGLHINGTNYGHYLHSHRLTIQAYRTYRTHRFPATTCPTGTSVHSQTMETWE